ncbi:MAG: hypothetical protein ACHQTE_02040 [Candidatus Saccharimonadales bacterium]
MIEHLNCNPRTIAVDGEVLPKDDYADSSDTVEIAAADAERRTVRRPQTVEFWAKTVQKRDIARAALRDQLSLGPTTAYEELGGGLRQANVEQELSREQPFDEVLRAYKPWMRDINLAVEKYGVLELTLDGIDAMTKDNRKILAIHFDEYMDRLRTSHRLIYAADGDVRHYDLLAKHYNKDNTRTREEMIRYAHVLESLNVALQSTGIPHKLHSIAHTIEPNAAKRSLRHKSDDQRHGDMQVVFDDKKPRIERVKAT